MQLTTTNRTPRHQRSQQHTTRPRTSLIAPLLLVATALGLVLPTALVSSPASAIPNENESPAPETLERVDRGYTPGFAPPTIGNHLPKVPSNCDQHTESNEVPYRNFCYPKRWADNWLFKKYVFDAPNLKEWIHPEDPLYRHWDFVTPDYDDTYQPGSDQPQDDRRGFQNVYLSGQAFRSAYTENRIVFLFHMKARVPVQESQADARHSYFLQLATSDGLKPLTNNYNTNIIKVFGKTPSGEYRASSSDFANFTFIPMSGQASSSYTYGAATYENGRVVQQPARIEIDNVKPGADLYVLVHAEIDPDTADRVDRYEMRARASATGGGQVLLEGTWKSANFGYPNSKQFYANYANAHNFGWAGGLNASRKSNKSVLATVGISRHKEPREQTVSWNGTYPYYDETNSRDADDLNVSEQLDRYSAQRVEKNGLTLEGTFVHDTAPGENAKKRLITRQSYEPKADVKQRNAERPQTDLIETTAGNQVINVRGEKQLLPSLNDQNLTLDNTREYTDSFLTMNVDTPEKIHERYAREIERIRHSGLTDTAELDRLVAAREQEQKREIDEFNANAQKGIFDLKLRVQGKDHTFSPYGNNYIFVIDNSASMLTRAVNNPYGESKLDVLKRTLKHAVDQLTENNDPYNKDPDQLLAPQETLNPDGSFSGSQRNNLISIITFSDYAWLWNGGDYNVGDTVLSPNGEQAKEFIDSISTGNSTNYGGALMVLKNVLDTLPKIDKDNRRKTQVVFITDGEPTASYKIEREFFDAAGKPYPQSTYEIWGDVQLGSALVKSLQSADMFPAFNTARRSFLDKLERSGNLGYDLNSSDDDARPCSLRFYCFNKSLERETQYGRYDAINTGFYSLLPNLLTKTISPYEPWCGDGTFIRPLEQRYCASYSDRRYIPMLDPQKTFIANWSVERFYAADAFGLDLPIYSQAMRYMANGQRRLLMDPATYESYTAMQRLDLQGGKVSNNTRNHWLNGYFRPALEHDKPRAAKVIESHGEATKLEIAKLRAEYPWVNFYAEAIPEAPHPYRRGGLTHEERVRAMRNLLLDGLAGGDPEHYAEVNHLNFDELFFKVNYPDTFQKRVNNAYIDYKLGPGVQLVIPSRDPDSERGAREEGNETAGLPSGGKIRLVYGRDYLVEASTSFNEDWRRKLDVVYDPATHTVRAGEEHRFDLGKYDWIKLHLRLRVNPDNRDVRSGKYVLVADSAQEEDGTFTTGARLRTRGPAEPDITMWETSRYFVVPSVRVEAQEEFAQIGLLKTGGQDGLPLAGSQFALFEDAEGRPAEQPVENGFMPGEEALGEIAREVPGAAFQSAQLRVGEPYWLVETQAPFGHELLAEAVQFVVRGDEEGGYRVEILQGASDFVVALDVSAKTKLPTINVRDVEQGHLPASGGRGLAVSLILGGALVAAGLGLRRRERGC